MDRTVYTATTQNTYQPTNNTVATLRDLIR
jgi:hypothetical protein